jgi:hypothetical protein
MRRRLFLTAALALVTRAAHAEPRPFPPGTKRGKLTPGYFPDILLDGKPRRLSPAARIFNTDNLIETPAALRGSGILVHYTENADGDIDRVWILTAEEARQPAPR